MLTRHPTWWVRAAKTPTTSRIPHTTDDPRTVAVRQLEHFGPSNHVARTFVALASLGTGTARDVSKVSEVPRTQVYDAIGELHDYGVVFMTVGGPLTEAPTERLREAAKRGVSINFGGVSADVQERIRDEVPEAMLFESLWTRTDASAGRVMMMGGSKSLVSGLVNGTDASASDPRPETAIWGEGNTNSLVVVLKATFTWRLDDPESA